MTRQEQKLQAFVINGDPDRLNTLSGQLASFGVRTQVFESAEQALEAMDPAEPPGLVVTGLRLPGIDGWRFCRLLRSPEFAAFKDVPVLVVSAAFAGVHSEHIAAEIGADAFLPAPVDDEEFAVVLQALLQGRKAGRHLRALIVDDDEELADRLVKAFQENGYITDKVHTAREAEEVFARVPCDVIVLDYHVSGGSGDALIDLFREKQPDCVLLVTAEDPAPELILSWMKRGHPTTYENPMTRSS
jgi:two-component system, cell cycle sensor histidine kinase and response regulator CckA